MPGFLSLRSDISELGTGLRAENAAMEESLRTEIGSLRADIGKLRADMIAADESLRAELRAELREFGAEFNEVARDHGERLARIEAAHPHPDTP